jgi:hypothetical protein
VTSLIISDKLSNELMISPQLLSLTYFESADSLHTINGKPEAKYRDALCELLYFK